MALKASVSKDAWEKLPDAIKAEYSEKDGKYVLQVTAVDGLALEDANSPTGARTALQKERAQVKELKEKLEAFGDMEPEAARDALSKVGEMAKWTPEQKVKEQVEAHGKQLADKHKKELDGRDTTIKGLNSQLEKVLVTNVATGAITKAGGGRSLKALLPYVKGATKLEKDATTGELIARVVDPDTGMTLVTKREGRHDPMTVEEFVESLRADEAFEAMFDAPAASGSGGEPGGKKTGGGGGNQKTVSATDPDALSANIDAIASGEVVVAS